MSRQHGSIRHFAFISFVFLLILAPVHAQAAAETAPTADHLLVWVENGPSPAETSPSVEGQLGLIDSAGEIQNLMAVPAQTSRLMPCGDEATSPDGSLFAFYMGLDSGELYLMSGGDAPKLVDSVNALTCLGGSTFQYSPDGTRLAYIAYETDANTSEFADGFLNIVGTSDMTEEFSYGNVTAFDMNNDGVAFVSFFTNDRNEADEAAVLWWAGNSEREMATLRSDEGCKYTSASIAIAPDGNLMVIMGHRCSSGDTRTSWQIYMIDVEAQSATMAATDFQAGSFAPYARTNNVIFSPDGQTAFFTIPDGIVPNTVSVQAVNINSMETTNLIPQQAVMATESGAPNAFPRFSPDGRWFAFVVTSPNNDNVLTVLDLSDSSAAPITAEAGSRNDVISDMAFSADSQHLIFISGTGGGGRDANNSLSAIDLSTGSSSRLKRGHFAPGLAVSPDGTTVAALDYQVLEDEKEPPYLNLITINADSGDTATLFEGATLVEGKVTDQRFAYPLAWRP
jgi:Tol biopolymer transport system component